MTSEIPPYPEKESIEETLAKKRPKSIQISAKCSDLFSMSIFDANDICVLSDYDGYVPDFMPEEHYGDYVILDIDITTGQILNWPKDVQEQVESFIEHQKAINS